MKRFLALTAIESPYRGRLVETQFLKPLSRALKGEPGIELNFLALTPIWYRFSRSTPGQSFLSTGYQIRRLRSWLAGQGAKASFTAIPYPWCPRQFNLTAAQAATFMALTLPRLLVYLASRPASLIVGRSYPAALLAWSMKRLCGLPYIFDMRGMYPEECVNAGAFAAGSTDYLFWKRRERRLVEDAAASIAVSAPFAEHINRLLPKARATVIPCCVDPDDVRYDPELRIRTKRKWGLEGRFVLLHLGSFGTRGDRGLIAKYLLRFRRARPDAILVAATGTPAFVPEIRAAFLREGLSEADFRIINPGSDQIDEVRAMGDAGLILERRVANTHVCLSVKLGEYLASGLPVICTPFVEGAARLVRGYDCGMIVDPDDPQEPLDKEMDFLHGYDKLRGNGFRLVQEYLSLERCAQQWRRIIEEVL